MSSSFLADQQDVIANVSLNLTKGLQGVKEILPEERFLIEARIASQQFNSTLVQHEDLVFKWELSTVDENTGQFSPFVTLVDSRANITVNSKEMAVGLTYIRVATKPKGVNGAIDYDFGFIRILPRLEGSTTGPNVALKGGGPIKLHAIIHGVLPDSLGIKAPTVAFEWSCREDNATTPNSSLQSDSFFDNHTNTEGCFGYDPGISHSINERSVLINPDFMVSKRTYLFQMLATQGSRSVLASHRIYIDTNVSLAIK